MSGGTWDYDDQRLQDLAERVREGGARWGGEEGEPMEFPASRAFVAGLLETLCDLLHDLDWHYAGDSLIADEDAWLEAAKASISRQLTERNDP